MSEGDRRQDVALDATVVPPHDAGEAATLPGGHGAPVGTIMPGPRMEGGGLAPTPGVDGNAETMVGEAHAATLAGPGVVADLTSLPKVDSASYAIGAEIARGGMGKILSARDRRLHRDVVIKVTRHEGAGIDPRFEREALITARLQHPSIVRVYEAGVLGDGRAFYAMERVRGRSLEVVLEATTTLSQRLALLPHAIAVADAIAYAHSEGVLHRDLKPSNVLIGPFGETVVIDWGLAKDMRAAEAPLPIAEMTPSSSGGSLTQYGSVLGTPSYMAPEQARGEAVDERTDIYALGALLYTLLTGATPYHDKTTEEVLHLVATGERTTISEREPSVPPELATIVERAMVHDPKGRYQSAKTLADELRQFAAGKLVGSHTYGLWRLLRRWLWRHRITVGVAVFAVIVLVVVGVLSFKTIDEKRRDAEAARATAEQAFLNATNAQTKAENQSADLLVSMAHRMLASDPSEAAAWLKGLRDHPQALEWKKTIDVARQAARLGMARTLEGHANDVEHVIASPDGIHVVTGSDDSTARYWRIDDASFVELRGHTGPIEGMAMAKDGAYLATAGTDHDVWLWELATGKGRRLQGHGNTVRGVAFSPDGKRLASTSEEGTLFIWDVATGAGKMIKHHHHGLRPVIWSHDGKHVIVGGYDGQIGWLDPNTGAGEMQQVHNAEVRTLALSPDGKYLAAGDEDGVATLSATDGSRTIRLAGHTDVVRRMLFTPDGTQLVSAGGDERVHVYSIAEGATRDLTGNTAGVKDIDISADGTWVASAGIDGSVWVWPIAGGRGRKFLGHRDAVKSVSFTRDGRLVSGSEDDRARIWRLDDVGEPPRGKALLGWLDQHTNITVLEPEAPEH